MRLVDWVAQRLPMAAGNVVGSLRVARGPAADVTAEAPAAGARTTDGAPIAAEPTAVKSESQG
jgi:hypothetical protein